MLRRINGVHRRGIFNFFKRPQKVEEIMQPKEPEAVKESYEFVKDEPREVQEYG
jgi:hypothetical protein